jgi:hypothetical protein
MANVRSWLVNQMLKTPPMSFEQLIQSWGATTCLRTLECAHAERHAERESRFGCVLSVKLGIEPSRMLAGIQ